jgi:hypothetical protein
MTSLSLHDSRFVSFTMPTLLYLTDAVQMPHNSLCLAATTYKGSDDAEFADSCHKLCSEEQRSALAHSLLLLRLGQKVIARNRKLLEHCVVVHQRRKPGSRRPVGCGARRRPQKPVRGHLGRPLLLVLCWLRKQPGKLYSVMSSALAAFGSGAFEARMELYDLVRCDGCRSLQDSEQGRRSTCG